MFAVFIVQLINHFASGCVRCRLLKLRRFADAGKHVYDTKNNNTTGTRRTRKSIHTHAHKNKKKCNKKG